MNRAPRSRVEKKAEVDPPPAQRRPPTTTDPARSPDNSPFLRLERGFDPDCLFAAARPLDPRGARRSDRVARARRPTVTRSSLVANGDATGHGAPAPRERGEDRA